MNFLKSCFFTLITIFIVLYALMLFNSIFIN